MSDILILGNKYSRKELGRIFNQKGITSSREGIYSSPIFGQFLFFIDLVKEGKEKRFHFNDYFDGDIFHWDSQTTQHINSPRIQQIVKKEIPILLFVRIYSKVKGQTQPFVYCGRIEYVEHDENTSKPVHIICQSLDYDENINNQDLIEIYNWKPELIGKTTSNNTYLLKKSTSKSRGEQKKPNYTERKGLVTSRVGQGWYRQEILKKWGNKCPITGCSVTEVLISSHIKRWSESNEDERLDSDNGILLSPNIDSLFDKYLISFEDNGSIMISNKIAKRDLEILGINENIKLKVDNGMKKFLSHHRSIFISKKG